MSKFYNGQKVLVVGYQEGITAMKKMVGKICTIKSAYNDANELEESDFLWIDEYLEPAKDYVDIDISEDNIMRIFA